MSGQKEKLKEQRVRNLTVLASTTTKSGTRQQIAGNLKRIMAKGPRTER